MNKLLPVYLCFLLFLLFPDSVFSQFKWPGGARAAVCLTYDDGLDCHLDVAVPQLDKYGFKGTFYCTGNSQSLYNRTDEWREIAQNGHELGNHTLFHPCSGKQFDWVKPEYDLDKYTVIQLLAELKTASSLLKAVDGKTERSFGYTCSNYVAGGKDFTEEIKQLFTAARGDGPIPYTMEGYNVYKTPSWCVDSHKAEELISYVEKAKANGTIAIFMFHNVGGGYLNVDSEEHKKLIEYLNNNRKDYYCATFKEVTDYISKELPKTNKK